MYDLDQTFCLGFYFGTSSAQQGLSSEMNFSLAKPSTQGVSQPSDGGEERPTALQRPAKRSFDVARGFPLTLRAQVCTKAPLNASFPCII